MCLLARQIKSAVTDSQGNGEASSSSHSSRLLPSRHSRVLKVTDGGETNPLLDPLGHAEQLPVLESGSYEL